ncbi:hypothetical protein R6Q57_002244 [Mikania cordata]
MSSSDEMEVGVDNMGVPVDDLEVDQFDELLDHLWLQFPQGTIARNRRNRLLKKEISHQKAISILIAICPSLTLLINIKRGVESYMILGVGDLVPLDVA